MEYLHWDLRRGKCRNLNSLLCFLAFCARYVKTQKHVDLAHSEFKCCMQIHSREYEGFHSSHSLFDSLSFCFHYFLLQKLYSQSFVHVPNLCIWSPCSERNVRKSILLYINKKWIITKLQAHPLIIWEYIPKISF